MKIKLIVNLKYCLFALFFLPAIANSQITVSELMYDPIGGTDFEFLELHNPTAASVNIGGWEITTGTSYLFPSNTTIPSGGYLLVIQNPSFAAFRAHYGLSASIPIVGPYDGKLSNAGEEIGIEDTQNERKIRIIYDTNRGWPQEVDGFGHSLVPVNTTHQPDNFLTWYGNFRRSTFINGSPGRADQDPPASMVLNEITAHTDFSNPQFPQYDSNDWIELYNNSDQPISLNGWYLSDNVSNLKKWAIPSGIIVPANGRITFDEITGFHSPITTGFGIDKAGEEVFLSHLPGTSLDRVVDSIVFKGQENFRSLSRFPDGADNWVVTNPTRNTPNTNTLPDMVISEVMYHPDPDKNRFEYIELFNQTNLPIALSNETGTWRLDGVNFEFPPGVVVPAQNYVLVLGIYSTDTMRLDEFKDQYGLTEFPPLTFGVIGGNLDDRNERFSLERPQAADFPDPPEQFSWVIVDEVHYFDQDPWDEIADGSGHSLNRINLSANGNNAENWIALPPSPGGPYVPADPANIISHILGHSKLQNGQNAQLDINGDETVQLGDYIRTLE